MTEMPFFQRAIIIYISAYAKVVSGFRIAYGEWESGFQQTFTRLPVYLIHKVDTVSTAFRGQTYVLHKIRRSFFTCYL